MKVQLGQWGRGYLKREYLTLLWSLSGDAQSWQFYPAFLPHASCSKSSSEPTHSHWTLCKQGLPCWVVFFLSIFHVEALLLCSWEVFSALSECIISVVDNIFVYCPRYWVHVLVSWVHRKANSQENMFICPSLLGIGFDRVLHGLNFCETKVLSWKFCVNPCYLGALISNMWGAPCSFTS